MPMKSVLLVRSQDALVIPPGMTGVGQFRGRAAGYMQVEPAYERPVVGLGADAPRLTSAQTAAVADAVRNLIRKGVRPDLARRLAVKALIRQHGLCLGLGRRRTEKSSGLGDVNDDAKNLIDTAQEEFATFVDKWNDQKTNDGDETELGRRYYRNAMEAARSDFVQRALAISGKQFPYQWSASDPLEAQFLRVQSSMGDWVRYADAIRAGEKMPDWSTYLFQKVGQGAQATGKFIQKTGEVVSDVAKTAKTAGLVAAGLVAAFIGAKAAKII